MRTKHFLFTLAIGALATACSQDEFNAQPSNTTDAKLSIRPEVGNVIAIADDPITRLTTQDGDAARPTFAENDKLGAAIIDVPAYNKPYDPSEKAIGKYYIVESYGCNNAFITTDGGTTWKSDQPMVEGNYLFYAPYQEGLAFRSPLSVLVPRIQDGSEPKKALKDFFEDGKNVVQVGYRFLASGNETKVPSVTMYDVFSYPKFTLKNNFDGYLFESSNGTVNGAQEATKRYNGEIVVDSIQFFAANNSNVASSDVVLGGQLKHTSGTAGSATAIDAANENDDAAAGSIIEALHQKENGFSTDGEWTILNKKLTTATESLIEPTGAIKTGDEVRHSQGGVVTTVTFGDSGKKLAKGGSLSFHAVFPAAQFSFDGNSAPKLVAKVYITIGENHYIIANATFDIPQVDQTDKLNGTPGQVDGIAFTANGNSGLTTLTFANGQKLPSEAIYIDATTGKLKPKTNVKDLLEINMTGGLPATGNLTKQIAVQYNPGEKPVDKVKTTSDLITLISNAATGINWVENAMDNASEKGYEIETNNSVEINSALIDALFNTNRYGKLTIATVVPISNDVKVTGVSGTKVTFESENGNQYDITLDGAVTTAVDASGAYAIYNSTNTPSGTSAKTVAIVASGTHDLETAYKSLHIVKGATATAAGKITVSNLRNDGTLTASDDLVGEILNTSDMTISKNVVGSLTNNGEIKVGDAAAAFTVNAGTGDVTINSGTVTNGIVVSAGATQRVIYIASGAVSTTEIKAAAAVRSVNTLKAGDKVTLLQSDVAELKAIKTIVLTVAGLETTESGTYNLNGITIDATAGPATWVGSVNATVNNATIVLNDGDLELQTINVNGTVTSKGTGKIVADGITAKWNGGEAK